MSIPSSEGGGGGGGLLLVDGLFGNLSTRAYMSPVYGPWTCWIGLSSVLGFEDSLPRVQNQQITHKQILLHIKHLLVNSFTCD